MASGLHGTEMFDNTIYVRFEPACVLILFFTVLFSSISSISHRLIVYTRCMLVSVPSSALLYRSSPSSLRLLNAAIFLLRIDFFNSTFYFSGLSLGNNRHNANPFSQSDREAAVSSTPSQAPRVPGPLSRR